MTPPPPNRLCDASGAGSLASSLGAQILKLQAACAVGTQRAQSSQPWRDFATTARERHPLSDAAWPPSTGLPLAVCVTSASLR
eukprot:scaffold16542_cov63-Phaeocystis_antarctica.AAC.1